MKNHLVYHQMYLNITRYTFTVSLPYFFSWIDFYVSSRLFSNIYHIFNKNGVLNCCSPGRPLSQSRDCSVAPPSQDQLVYSLLRNAILHIRFDHMKLVLLMVDSKHLSVCKIFLSTYFMIISDVLISSIISESHRLWPIVTLITSCNLQLMTFLKFTLEIVIWSERHRFFRKFKVE